MIDKINSFIHDLKKSYHKILSIDEAATKQAIILPLLQLLGWNPFDIDEVTPEYSVENKKVDYSLRINNTNEFFIEVKKPSEKLEVHQEQLLDYSFRQGVELATLTNGITWWFYLPTKKGNWQDRKFYAINIIQQDSEDITNKFIDLLSKENVQNHNALKNADAIYKGKRKKKLVKETLPEAWNKIITEPDSLLVDLLIETTEKLCGFKPESEEIQQFIKYNQEQLVVLTIDDLPVIPTRRKTISDKKSISPLSNVSMDNNISQDDLIPHIVEILGNHSGRASKRTVEEEIYQLFKDKFQSDWYQGTVSHGVLRWKHNIAFAKERAKLLHGYIKSARESGRGVWELTREGQDYYNELRKKT